jgi:YfiR/HmsC-like
VNQIRIVVPRRRLIRSVVVGAFAAMGAIGAMGFNRPAQSAEPYSEDAVKAAFIYRFAGFVDWPRQVEPIPTFTIAVMGSKEVASRLEALVADRKLHGRPVSVKRVSTVQEARNTQILYIGPNHMGNLGHLVRAVRGRSILVVTDAPSGLESGSSINLLMVDQRVRFEVSNEAARRAGLNISSGLLSVAVRVQGSVQ